MNDYVVKAIALKDQVRAYAVRSTETVREAQRRHDTLPTSSVALRTIDDGRGYPRRYDERRRKIDD